MSYPAFCTTSYYALGKSSWYDRFAACAEASLTNCGARTAGVCSIVGALASVTCASGPSVGSTFAFDYCPDDDYLTTTSNQYVDACDSSACPSFADFVSCSVRPIADYATPGTTSVPHMSYRLATVCREVGQTDTFERAARVVIAPRARASLPA